METLHFKKEEEIREINHDTTECYRKTTCTSVNAIFACNSPSLL
jgi:hypothetical protein